MTANQRATINGISTFGILLILAGIGVFIFGGNGLFMALFGLIIMIAISVASSAITKTLKQESATE